MVWLHLLLERSPPCCLAAALVVMMFLHFDTAAAGAGGDLLKHPKASPGRLTLLSYQQMEVPAADEGLLELAGRSAALLAPLLYDADLAAGRVPNAQANGNSGAHTAFFPTAKKGELRLVCRVLNEDIGSLMRRWHARHWQ